MKKIQTLIAVALIAMVGIGASVPALAAGSSNASTGYSAEVTTNSPAFTFDSFPKEMLAGASYTVAITSKDGAEPGINFANTFAEVVNKKKVGANTWHVKFTAKNVPGSHGVYIGPKDGAKPKVTEIAVKNGFTYDSLPNTMKAGTSYTVAITSSNGENPGINFANGFATVVEQKKVGPNTWNVKFTAKNVPGSHGVYLGAKNGAKPKVAAIQITAPSSTTVGVVAHKDDYYYANDMLSFAKIRQQLIDYMSYNGYSHNTALDNANIYTTPTAEGFLSNDVADKQYQAMMNGQTTEATKTSFIEAEIKKSVNDLVAELKKHKAKQYGIILETTSEHANDALIPTFKSNLTYTTNPAPDFTSKYYQNGFSGVMQATENGGNLGCNDYIFDRAKEITGQTISGSISALLPKGLTTADLNKIKADGYKIGTEPKKDAIAIEPDVGSYLGHFEYVEAVNGDEVTLSGANENDDYKYYGTVTRTKQDLKDWNTVYVYLK